MRSNIVSKRSQASRLLISICSAGVLLTTMSPMVHATSGRLADWQAAYPISSSDNNAGCALCHTDTNTNGALNPYGSAIRSSGLAGAESLNSDNDPTGSSNIVEINASTQPGWTGSAPTGVTGDLDPTVVEPAPVNELPVADTGGTYSGIVGIDVQFDASGSTDDGTIMFYDWDFGDGTTGTGQMPAHIYAFADTYVVTLTVTDNDGATDTATTSANISGGTNILPIANANGPYSGSVDIDLQFDGSGSSDPDGSIVSYAWDFGDGATGTGVNPMHIYTTGGTYDVTLTVTDDAGDTASDTTTATIGTGQLAPVADANGPYTGITGNLVTFDGSGSNDSDGNIVFYDWNFGDGTVLEDGGPNPTHTYATAGTYNVTLTVTDNDGLMDSDSTSAGITDQVTSIPEPSEEADEADRDDEERDDEERDDDDRDDDDRDDDDRDDDERDYDYRDRDYDRD